MNNKRKMKKKKTDILPHGTVWMTPEDVMLSEIRQQKISSFTW
jgi:hypothetical protein